MWIKELLDQTAFVIASSFVIKVSLTAFTTSFKGQAATAFGIPFEVGFTFTAVN